MEDNTLQKLLEENASLRQELNRLKELGFTSQIHILSTTPKLKISGVLIAEGVWKGVKYLYDEMKKALSKFLGLPIKVMHGHSEEFGDKTVGKVYKVGKDDLLKAITFEGIVEDPKAVQLINEGVFNAVSIKGGFEKLDDSQTPPVGLGYTPIEVSLTGSPACENCMIFNVESLSKSLNNSHSLSLVGEDKMPEQEVEEDYIEIKENDVLVLPDNWEELEDFSIVDAEVKTFEDALKELAEKKQKPSKGVKVVKIIKVPAGKYPSTAKKVAKVYGYPYPYYGYPYYYPYYYYYYPYYGYPQAASEDILDIMPLEENYRQFMKECMKGGKSMKECALEWKKRQEASEEEETELATIKCPVCGQVFESKKAFLQHWKEKHEAKYGAYQLVKRIIKKMLEDKTFTRKFKRIMELGEEENEEGSQEAEAPKETTEEVKSEEEKKEEGSEKEETEEKKEETRAEETTAKSEVEISPEKVIEIGKKKGMSEAEIAASLLVEEFSK